MKPATKSYVSDTKLQKLAMECVPTSGSSEYALYSFANTNLYQWWKRTGAYWEPYGKVMELKQDGDSE